MLYRNVSQSAERQLLGEVRTNLRGTPTHGDRRSELARDFGRIYVKKHSQAGAWTLGRLRHYARNAFDIDQHTFLSNSGRCRSIPWMETLPSLGTPFDALGLDFTRRGAHVRCNRDPDL